MQLLFYPYRTKEHANVKIIPYEMSFGVRPRNADSVQFTVQLLGEERLLAIQDKRDKVHAKLAETQAEKRIPELNFKRGDLVLVQI